MTTEDDERRNQWPVHYLLRPLARRVLPILLRLGIGADAVTLAGTTLALVMPATWWLADPWAGVGLGAMALLLQVIDCLDGDIARTRGTAGRRGAYLDAASDILGRTLFYVAAGMLAARSARLGWTAGEGAAAGLACAWAYLFSRFLRDWVDRGAGADASVYGETSRGDRLFGLLVGLDHVFGAILAALALAGRPDLFLGLLALYSAGDLVATQILLRRRLAP